MSIEQIAAGVPAPTPPADVRTVRAAAAGDLAAFESLAEASLGPSFRLAAAILGDAVEAGQATQHALVAAWGTLPRLDPPEEFDAWLRRLLVDECRMRLRQREPASRAAPATRPEAATVPEPSTGDTASVDRATVLDAVEAAFERLDADDRAIVALYRLEGRPVAQIATLLHLPAGTVKLHLHETHAALAEALAEV